MKISLFPLLFAFLVLGGCKSQKSNNPDQEVRSQADDGLTMIMSDFYGGTASEELQVIRSQKALDNFFLHVNKTRKPGLTPPSVDFDKNILLVYCTGETSQEKLPKLYASTNEENTVYISKKMDENAENQQQKAILMPFGLYIMPLTEKDIVLQPDS